MIYSVIAFLLALIPILFIPGYGDSVRTPKEVASILGLIIIISMIIRHQRLSFKSNWLSLFWIWSYITIIFNNSFFPAVIGYLSQDEALFATIQTGDRILTTPLQLFAWKEMFYITIAFLSIVSIASIEKLSSFKVYNFKNFSLSFRDSTPNEDIKGFANIISWMAILLCGYAIIQAIGLDPFFRATNHLWKAKFNTDPQFSFTHRVVATIGNPTILATWLAICLPFMVYRRGKIGWIAFLSSIFIIAITDSSTAIIASILSLLFYLFFKYKKTFTIMTVTLMIVGSLAYAKTDMKEFLNPTGRITVHKKAWQILKEKPLFGIGLGSFEYLIGRNPKVVKELNEESWRELHDDVGQIWWSHGLIGLVLFIGFIMSLFIRFLKNITDESLALMTSLVCFLLICFTLFPMRIAPTSFYGVIITGLLLNVTRRKIE